jgi:hypothetical protein
MGKERGDRVKRRREGREDKGDEREQMRDGCSLSFNFRSTCNIIAACSS